MEVLFKKAIVEIGSIAATPKKFFFRESTITHSYKKIIFYTQMYA